MKTSTKIWIIIAAVLVAAGITLFVIVMAPGNWNFKGLWTAEFVSTTIDVEEDFRNISFESDTARISIQPSTTGTCRVGAFTHKKVITTAEVSDGTLKIRTEDTRRWYEKLSFSSDYELVLYLPRSEYDSLRIDSSTGKVLVPKDVSFGNIDIAIGTGDVDLEASASEKIRVKTSTGGILVENVTAGELDLTSSTGDITVRSAAISGAMSFTVSTGDARISDVTCKDLRTKGSTGDVILENVIAAGSLSVERSTGDVRFDKCDAQDMTVKTSTGSVKGSLLTGKVFSAGSGTGKVTVPDSDAAGGKCVITTSTGRINITIAGQE